VLHVIDGTRRRSEIEYVIDLATVERLAVVELECEPRFILEVREVLLAAGDEVVDAKDFVPLC
jgi:hypothetical protein